MGNINPGSLSHSSVEGAQHGAKGLLGFLDFAQASGAVGAQPSCSMLEKPNGGFMSAVEIRNAFGDLKIDGISAHGLTWLLGSAFTESKTICPFVPKGLRGESVSKIEKYAEEYILRLLDLCAELGVKVIPMFWGVMWGWEVATGYPWGFWKGDGYDLITEGDERAVRLTAKIRARAKELGIIFAHEIHGGTGAMTAQDYLRMHDLFGGEACGVNFDPSHCWEGESWQRRLELVGPHVVGAHVKDHIVRDGHPLRCMEPDWQRRPMQFTALGAGQIDLLEYAQQLQVVGYHRRYCELMGTKTAPLVVEAEGAFEDLDSVSAAGIWFVNDVLCFPQAAGSFEDGMGAQD
jgi:sugar phosphate isomerase/epimerase